MMRNVSIRVQGKLLKQVEALARLQAVDRSAVMREALERGLAAVRLKVALELFSTGKASTSEAAEIAGLAVGEMMDELARRGLRPEITPEDLRGDVERALKLVE